MKALKKIYYKFFPTYNVLETKFVTYSQGEMLLRNSTNKPESEKWVLAKEEDTNRIIGMVYLCRRVRIHE